MAEAFYPPMPATDGTFSPVPGGVFEVFELTDTERSTPLPLRVGDGNSSTTVAASDTLAILPGTYVTSPNVSHNWVSGQFIWRRDSFDRAQAATEESRVAAASSEASAAISAQAAIDAAGLVEAPADQVMRDAAANPASLFGAYQRANFVAKDTLVINVKDRGAKGDGVTDDTAAIQDAINTAATFGLSVFFPKGRYRLTGQVTVPSGTALHLSPEAVIDISAVPGGTPALLALGTWGAPVALSADAAARATTISVTSAAGVTAGTRLKVSSNQSFGTVNQPRGEIVQVESVSGTTLTLTAPLADSYPVASDGRVEKMNPVERISVIGGGRIEGPPTDPNKLVIGLQIEAATNVTLDLSTRWCHQAGVRLFDVVGYQVKGGSHDEALLSGFGYGVQLGWACQDGTIEAIRGTRLRHLVTVGGGTSRRGIVRGLTVSHSVASQVFDAGFDVHPSGEIITFNGCIVWGSKSDGFISQGGKAVFNGCIATDVTRHGFIAQAFTIRGFDVAFNGCSVSRAGGRGITGVPDTSGNAAYRVWTAFSVVGGSISDTTSYGISVENTDTTYSIANVDIRPSSVTRTGSSGVYLRGTVGAKVDTTVTASGAAAEAVYMFNAPDTTVKGVIDVNTTARAVRFVSSPDSLVSGARIKNPGGIGVMTDAASTGTLVAANKVTAATRFSLAAGTTEVNNA